MEALTLIITVITVIAALLGFDLLALRFGVDSRDSIRDDHAWTAGFGSRTGGSIR